MTVIKGFKRILAPVDFSPCSERALASAVSLAAKSGARVDVLHLWEPTPYVSPTSLLYLQGEPQSFWDHMRHDLHRRLEGLVERCRGDAAGVPVRTYVAAGYPSTAIIDQLEREPDESEPPYDLVVMGTHGRSWLAHVLLGSVAARIVRHAPCPVLTVRTHEPEGEPQRQLVGGTAASRVHVGGER